MTKPKRTDAGIKYYLMEAAGLGGFVVIAGLLVVFLEHPGLPVMQTSWKSHPLLRRVPLGFLMGLYVSVVTVLWGKKSGAHLNPAVTWAFYRLGKIRVNDAVFYTVAQFGGAIAAAQILKYTVGKWFSHPAINYGVTAPRPPHTPLAAFVAEFIISFLMMFVILFATGSKNREKAAPALAGILIAVFILFEMPFSGMSLNPARSTAGALAAMKFEHLWLYFVSPVSAMLLAAFAFRRRHQRNGGTAKMDGPVYPVQNP